jgi:hypothetical protein
MTTRIRGENRNEKMKVQSTRFEHAFIAAIGLGTYRLMRDSDIVTLELDEEQRELIAGELRNFMGELTRKILADR